MDTKLLKQKILDLAIRGKLVPQNPADEPASVLLERIKAEKAQLIKEGKIKKEKPLPPIEEVPFEIPESWEWCRIKDISSQILYGVSESAKPSGSYKLLRITDIQNNSVNWETVPYTDFDVKKANDYLLTPGDILFARTGATVGKSYLVTEAPYLTIYASYLIRVKTSNLLLPNYVKYYFESGYYWGQISENSIGTGQPNVNGTVLSLLYIPLPPLEEQKRIVAEIDRWFKCIDELEQNQQYLHTAIQQAKSKILDLAIHGKLVAQDPNDEPASILLERTKAEKAQLIKEGKIKKEKPLPEIDEVPFVIPHSWKWCRLGEIGNWQSGGTPSRTNKSYYEGNIPWLKTGDLNDGFITSIPESISEEAVANSSAKLNPVNSVLIAMYGATIGKVGILTFPATTNQACCACSYYQPVEMMYLFYFLLSQRSEFISKGGGGAQPNISKEIIIKTEFPLPPQAEQKRIVTKIEELFAQLDKIEESLN